VLGILGAALDALPLKKITWSSEMRKWSVPDGPDVFHSFSDNFRSQIDDIDSRLGFASYVNRGTEMLRQRSTGPQ
jgi:hypothetical protein